MNLPNAITLGRIVLAPLVALLPFHESYELRFIGFVLFLIVAISDYYDGKLARSRNLETDLGRLLDPLADKLLLLATFVPMYILQTSPRDGLAGLVEGFGDAFRFPFETPFGSVPLPWWVLLIVLGRELLMTILRQIAAGRGVVIGAIGPAKWKTGFQWTWVGAAFFWFGAQTAAFTFGWSGTPWRAFAWVNGLVGSVSMVVAVFMTLYSLWLYLRRYGRVFIGAAGHEGAAPPR